MALFGLFGKKKKAKKDSSKLNGQSDNPLPPPPPKDAVETGRSRSPPAVGKPQVSDEMLPVATLIQHQQQRHYYSGTVEYRDMSPDSTAQMEYIACDVTLNGSNLTIMDLIKPLYINICDCELSINGLEIYVMITEHSQMSFKFPNEAELVDFYSAILLSKFEYTQLQEAYTGALLSSEAIHFSDIRTLLDPHNRKHAKEEWCVLRFPYLNGKWLRCLVVIKAHKIEIYLNAKKTKKQLLATIIDGKTIHGVYSGSTSTIKDNSLVRVWGDCYIDVDLLNKVLANEEMKSQMLSNGSSYKRSTSLSKRLSLSSIRSGSQQPSIPPPTGDDCSTSSSSNKQLNHGHRRMHSIETTASDSSFNSKTPKKLVKRNILQTHLVYIIPETHGGVKPVEIMLRLVIPMMNTFELYGRPQKFISSRNETESLLFGLPQLPQTQYLSSVGARDLVQVNLVNSLQENWSVNDWNMVFKQLVSVMMEKRAESIEAVQQVKYEKPVTDGQYDPMADFQDESGSENRSNLR